MSVTAISRLGQRMARRNNLYLFAWLCATVLPAGLQWLAGSMEDARDYLAYYYGALSLWMFFSLTYGFATIFVSYYLVSGYRRAGTLDLLRVSDLKPWQVSLGIFAQTQVVLVPPILGFAVLYTCYLLTQDLQSFLGEARWSQIVGFAVSMLLNELLLAAIPCLVIYRREGIVALVALLLVPVVNALPIVLLYALHWPLWVYLPLLLSLIGCVLALSTWNLARMWPPQRTAARS